MNKDDYILRRELRKHMRAKRASLSKNQQFMASINLARQLACEVRTKKWKSCAVYLANAGEIDLNYWITNYAKNKKLYLPIVDNFLDGKLKFGMYDKKTLQKNRYDILQPRLQQGINFNWLSLDAILLPLVAFDKNCNRIGMGGGYYDKTLTRLNIAYCHRPWIIGVAHSFQQVDKIPTASWDISLDAIVTERQWFFCKKQLGV